MGYLKVAYNTKLGRPQGMLYHIPPASANGRKHLPVLFLPGGGERGISGDITTSNGIDKVAQWSLPKTIAPPSFTTLGNFYRPNGDPAEYYQIAVFAIQCNTNEFYTVDRIDSAIDYIAANFSSTCDMSRLMLTGISAGGNGVMVGMSSSVTNPKVAFFAPICPYLPTGVTNYEQMAKMNAPCNIYHSVSDPTSPISEARRITAGITAFSPTYPVNLIEFKGETMPNDGLNGHNMDGPIYSVTNRNFQSLKPTGEMWVKKYYLFEIAGLYTTNRFKKP